ncbi:hypothetical protein CYMTET_21262 [Cymbomonas tetramitiformis]|uniref:C3H1-type domain-containing protein n=1 Tax=Cymbomonas tetramitiformis TaxID=36881 RepID=A0AAE0G2E6_9CHLO|nr:hypothetical protein CYMTET_21262 [Cymbomonas tetramitiformis]
MRLMERTAGRPGDSALFVMEKVTGRRASTVPMTHDALVAGVKSLAERVGLNPASYAGHSLRRGGATAAMRLHVNSSYIKMQGDWKSDCFERYCELDTEQKLILPGAMAEAAATVDRLATWQKQRAQIMAWVTEHGSELQEIPEAVGSLTDALIEAELFSVDAAGALVLGAWPAVAGAWAVRKTAEIEKFDAVSEWVRMMLALRLPVPTGASPSATTGGAGASGGGGAAPSGAPTAPTAPTVTAGGSGAGASVEGGPGGGAPAGAAGAQGGLGTGTIAAAIAAPGAGASALVQSITATTGGTGTTTGSTAWGGPAALGAGATVVDPQSIVAAIAAAIGAKLDAFGERLATLEAHRSTAGSAPAVLSGMEPPEARELRCAIRDSVATAEDWDVPRCVQACTDLVHEAARLRPQLTTLRGVHPFGKTPMRTLEAHAFEPLAFILPEVRVEECELDELPPGSEATLEHWRAFVHLLQARVGEFQRFVKSQVPTFPISDVMVASFFRKRKRVTFEGDEEEARAAGGGRGALPPLDAARRDRLATLGAGFRTVNEEQLARALRGELAPEDVVRPPGAGPPLIAVPSRGALAGIDLVVSPVQRLLQEDEGRLKLKYGELTMVPKKKKSKNFAEWEQGFLRILCEAPAEARDDLMDFVEWARTIAAEFLFYHFSEFYEHLVRQVQRSATGISHDGYDRVWRVYRHMADVKEKVKEVTKKPYSWRRDAGFEQPKQTAPEDAGGGRGKGKGAGGRGGRGGRSGGRGGRGGISDACYGHNEGNCKHQPNCHFRHLRADILLLATIETMEACGTSESERRCFEEECVRVGRESGDGHIFLAGWRLPLGVIALGMVEKLEHDEFTTVKEAYGMMRPGYWMVKAEEAMMLLVEFVTFLGFKINNAKCEGPAQVLEFLGVLLDTSGAASIDEERIAVVVQKAGDLRAQAARGMVARRRLESLLGRMVRLPRPVLDDLSVLEQVVRRYNGKRVLLERQLVDQRHFAMDASGTLGFGGVWEHLFFMLSWEDLARMSGTTVVVRIDNQSAMYQPVYITTKDNLLANLLSWLDMPRFLAEHKAFLRADIWRQDRDDWMVCPKFDGHNAWGNLPFSIMFAILKNFLKCKRRQQWGTAACFLVPVWDGDAGWELVKSLPQELQREAERYQAEALAPETRRCYGTGVRAFVTFCISFACLGCLEPLLPATDVTLCMFITYCSWPVMPLTLADLAKMAVLISSHDLGQEALWAAILVGFFGLFRKDNLTTGKAGSLLCPVRALMRLMQRTAGLGSLRHGEGDGPASCGVADDDALVAGIKSLAERLGLDPSSYAGHSLRRGGATAAMRLDVASIYIKMQGDWKSDCFERYCELDTEQKLILPGAMAEAAAAADR